MQLNFLRNTESLGSGYFAINSILPLKSILLLNIPDQTSCQGLKKECGYFAGNSILPLEAILPLLFMCDYTALIAVILAVMLKQKVSAAALKCNIYGLESLLAGHLEKGSAQCGGVQSVV